MNLEPRSLEQILILGNLSIFWEIDWNFHLIFTQFSAIANYTRSLDPTRPITASIAVQFDQDKAVNSMIFSFNKSI
jgi:hypothetical protein